MKIIYFDLETTGVMHWKNGIHQISGIIEIDGNIVEEFDFNVQPNPAAIIDDKALEIGGVTKEQVMAYPPMGHIYGNLLILLSKYVDKFNKNDKFFLVGYNNASFDNQFLRAFFVQNNDNYFGSWFWSSSMDVMVLASEFLKHRRAEMLDFKLKTVARKIGIEVKEESLHNATYDIMLTREIYKHITDGK